MPEELLPPPLTARTALLLVPVLPVPLQVAACQG